MQDDERTYKLIVLENARPACYPLSTQGWDRYPEFETEHAAVDYLDNWLGAFSPGKEKLYNDIGREYAYNGYDKVLIAKIYLNK